MKFSIGPNLVTPHQALQTSMSRHPVTCPLLGVRHTSPWWQISPAEGNVLDGDLLSQLLHLPQAAQQEILAGVRCGALESTGGGSWSPKLILNVLSSVIASMQ